MAVAGIDGCGPGWIGVRLDDDGTMACRYGADIVAVTSAVGPVGAYGMDVPIALTDRGWRAADQAGRAALGHRAATLFMIPPRSVLDKTDHPSASACCRELTGQGVTRQAYGLRDKVEQARRWVAGAGLVESGVPVVEVHPELSFVVMGEETGRGRPRHAKKRWAGFWERIQLLEAVGIAVGQQLADDSGRAAPDDVLDAIAAAWSARRVIAGTARRFPPADPPDGSGIDPTVPVPMAVWA